MSNKRRPNIRSMHNIYKNGLLRLDGPWDIYYKMGLIHETEKKSYTKVMGLMHETDIRDTK